MGLSVKYKLFLTLLLAMGLAVAGMLVFTQWSLERGFIRYVSTRQQVRTDYLVERLAEVYRQEGGWQTLANDKRRWIRLLLESRGGLFRRVPSWAREAIRDMSNAWPPPVSQGGPGGRVPVPLELRLMLLDGEGRPIFGRVERVAELMLNPIRVDGKDVGFLGMLPGPALDQMGEILYVQRQTRSLVWIGVITVALSALLALFLAKRLVRPVHTIRDAARGLAEGRYETRVAVEAGDELGHLARDFNSLAEALERTDRSRREWLADVSHELRTPLAVLRGELEALQDGLRSIDRAAVDSLYDETRRLSRLVDDLYELARSEVGGLDYRMQVLDPLGVLEDELEALKGEFQRRELCVHFRRGGKMRPRVQADPDRLAQLFRNLLWNTLRYTDPGGELDILVTMEGGSLIMDFQDSAPGVPDVELRRLFERFYRVDGSRSRGTGGAGLGLALCRAIIEAHQGRIESQASPLGGLWIRIRLPIKEAS